MFELVRPEDYTCEHCGTTGGVVEVWIVGVGRVMLHFSCEQSRAAKVARMRAAGGAGCN